MKYEAIPETESIKVLLSIVKKPAADNFGPQFSISAIKYVIS